MTAFLVGSGCGKHGVGAFQLAVHQKSMVKVHPGECRGECWLMHWFDLCLDQGIQKRQTTCLAK